MSKEDKLMLTELYPLVEKGLSKKQNTVNLKKAVGEYIDRNSDKLTAIGPIRRPTFLDRDIEHLYHAIEVNPNLIKSTLKKSGNIKGHWKIMAEPFNTASVLAIRYYTLKKDEDMVNTVLIYHALSMYPSLHKKYFAFEPNENIMNYTINNLSNKFKIKQLGTLLAALIDTAQGSYRLYKDGIIKGTDKDFVDFVMGLKTRLNSLMRNISNEFYDNHDNNRYLNLDSDSYEEDNYHEADSNTYAVERMTNKITLELTVNGPSMKLVSVAARYCQVSTNELRNYVTSMITNEKREDIRTIIESILFLYLFNDKNTTDQVGSERFLLYCLGMYKKSNTTDENIIKIKKVLDEWLEELGTYKKTQRLATINNFRRALFVFFVITIQTSANRNR